MKILPKIWNNQKKNNYKQKYKYFIILKKLIFFFFYIFNSDTFPFKYFVLNILKNLTLILHFKPITFYTLLTLVYLFSIYTINKININ